MKIITAPPHASPDQENSLQGVGPTETGLPSNLRWSVIKNTVAQVVGRILSALSRLVVAGIIVRRFGKDTFGEYSLILVLMVVAEWLLDFGVSDFFVREICREPERKPFLLRVMTKVKIVQLPAGFAFLVAILFGLRYPAPIIKAGIIGGTGMVFFAGVLAYRVVFRASLAVELDVAAELISVLAMVVLVRMVSIFGGGLSAIFACYVVSRGVFLVFCFLFGRSRYHPSVRGVTWNDIGWSLRSSAAIGTVGLLVVIYEALDLLLLSRLGSLSEVANYSGAQRFIFPFLTCLAAIGGTLYPIAASYWPHARSEFEAACQRALDVGMLLCGLAICPMLAAPDFFLGLLGPSLVSGAPVLRVLALNCLVKAITMTLGPVLYVLHAQKHILKVVVFGLAFKTGLIVILAPRFGAMGVACGVMATDVLAVGASIYLVQHFSGYRIRWIVALKVLIISVAVAVLLDSLSIRGLAAAVAAVVLFCPLVLLTGALRLSELQSLLKNKTS